MTPLSLYFYCLYLVISIDVQKGVVRLLLCTSCRSTTVFFAGITYKAKLAVMIKSKCLHRLQRNMLKIGGTLR